MADLTITAANVIPGANSSRESKFAGEAIAAGKSISIDPTDGKAYLSDANHATAARRRVDGIAVNGAGIGQVVGFHKSGDLNPGATVAIGTIYCLSATAGGICPAADLASGYETTVIGIATTVSNIAVNINNSGVLIP